MQNIKKFSEQTFSSLKIENYRLYFIGQAISLSGTWMQTIAQGLLVLKLTNSGTILGLVTAFQFLPVLFLAPFGGLIADKYSKQRILLFTQSFAGLLALVLGIVVITNTVQVWMVFVLALGLGFVNAFDNPARQSFLVEMVGHDNLQNVVALNSSEVNLARAVGPIIAGILAATVGLGICFIVNAFSYLAVLIVLSKMDLKKLHSNLSVAKRSANLIEGFKYVKSNELLRDTLIMMAIVGTLTFEFQVILPLFAQFAFKGGAETYAALMSSMGVGAVIGGLYSASRKNASMRNLVVVSLLFGGACLVTSISPNLIIAMIVMVVVGFFSINFGSLGNVMLQLESIPQMRGRVMALYSVAFLGSTPIGGPIIGFIGEHFGPRYGLAVGGTAAIVAAGVGALALRRDKVKSVSAISQIGIAEDSSEKDSGEI